MKTIKLLFLTLLCATGFYSCSNSDDNPVNTPITKGQPTEFKINGILESYHYTNGNQLSKIIYNSQKSDITEFHYSGNELTKCTFTHTPPVMGISKIEFQKTDSHKIIATISLPENVLYHQTIELNDDGLPIRINDIVSDIPKDREVCLCELSYYPGSNKLYQKKFFSKQQEETHTHTFIYDNKPGSTSQIDFPLWGRIYLYGLYTRSLSDEHWLNYTNNQIRRETVVKFDPSTKSNEYQYTYDEEGYPISVIEPMHGYTISIKY